MINQLRIDSVWVDAVGNVLGLIKGSKRSKTIAVDGHLDTVFPEDTDVRVRLKGDTLFAPGIGDNSRGLAMILSLIRAITNGNIRTEADILFVGSVGEEGLGDLRGVKQLFSKNSPKIDSWISIDGGAIGRLATNALGSRRYRVTFNGQGGHSWGAFGIVNPHHTLGDAINRLVNEGDKLTKFGPRTSYNVGRIGGGTSVNSVPFESWMEIDIRSMSLDMLDKMEAVLRKSVEEAVGHQNKIKRLGKDLSAEIKIIGDRPSGDQSPGLPLIQRAMACTAYFGKRPQLMTGSTNSNTPIALKVPAVTIGRGGISAEAHSLHEWWVDKEAYKSVQLALLLLISEAGLAI